MNFDTGMNVSKMFLRKLRFLQMNQTIWQRSCKAATIKESVKRSGRTFVWFIRLLNLSLGLVTAPSTGEVYASAGTWRRPSRRIN
jgi:hypothetical protein